MLRERNVIAFIPTRNSERAKTFYANTLGLTFVRDDHFALLFEAKHVVLRLVRLQEFQAASYTVLGWCVDDIAAVVSALKEKQVECEKYDSLDQDVLGIWTAPSGARVAWFKDPDGNLLSVTQSPDDP